MLDVRTLVVGGWKACLVGCMVLWGIHAPFLVLLLLVCTELSLWAQLVRVPRGHGGAFLPYRVLRDDRDGIGRDTWHVGCPHACTLVLPNLYVKVLVLLTPYCILRRAYYVGG